MRARLSPGVRATLSALTAAAALAAAPAAASAATVTVQGDSRVSFDAADAKADNVTVTSTATGVTFTDTADTISAPGCAGDGTNTVTCSPADFQSWSVNLLDLNDKAVHNGIAPGEFYGGAGTDELTGGEADEFLEGGDGADTITGNGGEDRAEGTGEGPDADRVSLGGGDDSFFALGGGNVVDLGPGSDEYVFLPGATGAASIEGGPGFDLVLNAGSQDPFGISLNLTAGSLLASQPGDVAETVSGFEDLSGTGAGGDTVTGTAGPNQLDTSRGNGLGILLVAEPPRSGNDTVDGLAGPDTIVTGQGNDTIQSVDGFADRVECGDGVDTVRADQFDTLDACENVTTGRVRAAVADLRAPACSFTRAARKARRTSFLRGYSAIFRCDEAVTATGRILMTAKRRRGRTVLARAGDVTLAEKSTSAAPNAPRKLTLKVSRKLRKALGKKFTARISIEARDEFGNRRTITRKVKVSTPKKKRKRRR